MKLIFVRHGEPNYKTDSLTETGHLQAQAAAARLKDEGIRAIYTSPLGRARQTAAYTAEQYGLDVEVLPFMHELSWGKEPNYYHPWQRSRALAAEGVDLLDTTFTKEPDFPGKALFAQVAEAAQAFDAWLAERGYIRDGKIYRCAAPSEETLAIFSHGGSSSAVMAHLLGLPYLYFCNFCPLDFTSVSIIRMREEDGIVTPCLGVLNDHTHILGIE